MVDIIKIILIFFIAIFSIDAESLPGVEATEYTQILNHEVLLENLSKLINLVQEEQEIKDVIIKNYQILEKQAEKLGPAYFQKIANQKNIFSHFFDDSQIFQNIAQKYSDALSLRIKEMSYMKMTPHQYFEKEIDLAHEIGGVYQKKLEEDNFLAKSLNQKANQLSSDINNIQSISGTVAGIQMLNSTANQLRQQLVELEKIFTKKALMEDYKDQIENKKESYREEILKNIYHDEERRAQRDTVLKKQLIKPSWTQSY